MKIERSEEIEEERNLREKEEDHKISTTDVNTRHDVRRRIFPINAVFAVFQLIIMFYSHRNYGSSSVFDPEVHDQSDA